MIDRDKLLRGLECCNHTGRELYRGGCSHCPYHDPDDTMDCRTRRDLDTLELLNEDKTDFGNWISVEDYLRLTILSLGESPTGCRFPKPPKEVSGE